MLEISGIGVLTAFAAGVISFLSPCVLPLVPGYVSYVAGQSLDELEAEGDARRRAAALLLSFCFVAGFSVVFIGFGASATAIGGLLLDYRYEFGFIAGVVVILFGLFLLGAYRLPVLDRDIRFHARIPGGRPLGAGLLGMAFAFGWTPCIGPVLGGILAVSASTAEAGSGVALLAIYSLGLGVPFLLAAAFTGAFLRRLKGLRRFGKPLHMLAGVVLIGMGVLMITGDLPTIALWLLDTFPVLATIG
ncbi:MAG: cytochrome c biogenesis protein CcdA [Alphaproteobacteria bacterium]|nr:cytochrome c biogenesis protein CcdA [Alphaproteobacteria bacterium]